VGRVHSEFTDWALWHQIPTFQGPRPRAGEEFPITDYPLDLLLLAPSTCREWVGPQEDLSTARN
jgi:hypothetical protein